MQDMISQIVEMDRKAREVTEEVQRNKVSSQHEVVSMCEKIRNDYLERARKRIKLNEETEREAANKTWEIIQSKHLNISKKLDKTYADKCDEWVNTIFQRVLGA